MPDSDARPEQAEVEQALDELAAKVEKVPPLLSGAPVEVTLTISVAEAYTPQEAVDQFMKALTRFGTDALYFFIEDESTGEQFAIKGGEIFDARELLQQTDEAEDDRESE